MSTVQSMVDVPANHGISKQFDFWLFYMHFHKDDRFVQKILRYVYWGIGIGYKGQLDRVDIRNWPSALDYREKVTEFIQKHLEDGSIQGPYDTVPHNFRSSPLGAFMKKGKTKIRVIHDLSWPPDKSVNDGIDKEDYSVSYASVSDAVSMCSQYKTPWLAKCDLADAYLSCPVQENDRDKIGFTWQENGIDRYYRYASIPFGLRSSARAFSDLAEALLFIAKHRGVVNTALSYLDDTIIVAGSESECRKSLQKMTETARKCGFVVQDEKTAGPARKLEFLGIQIDTESKKLQVTEERLQEITLELQQWVGRDACTKRELLSLTGKLAFCAKVVTHGSKFTRRLIHTAKRVKNLHHKLTLSSEAKKDIVWWLKCIRNHNGVKWFESKIDKNKAELLFTDASDKAMAGVWATKWVMIQFAGEFAWMAKKSIAWREMAAVVMAVATFGPWLKNRAVVMNIDNKGIQEAIKRGKSRDPQIMALIRSLYFYTATFKIEYDTVHLYSHVNASADALSRYDMQLFRTLNPGSDQLMTKPADFLIDF